MKSWTLVVKALVLLSVVALLFGCSNEATPPLAAEGEPTLVYIYTEA